MAMECWPSRSKRPRDTCRARQSMNQRKFETRGRPRWTTAPPPRRRAAGLFQLDSIATDPALGSNSPPSESGLAAAVRADQPIALSAAELHGHIREKGLGPELHGDVG